MSNVDAVMNKIGDARRIKVAVTDIDGILRGKYISADKLRSALSGGFGFCDVVFGWDSADECYDNITYTGWHSGYPDAHARLVPETLRNIPWENDTPFLLGEFVNKDGSPMPLCPRQILKRVIEAAKNLGYSARFGVEFEWFNFIETPSTIAQKGYRDMTPLTPGMFGYSVLRSSLNHPFFGELMELCGDFGVPVEGLHTETGPGVLEAAIANCDALEAADRAVLFKNSAKEIAYRHGIMATFMAKWNHDLPGCSGHIHQSLWNKEGENIFHDGKNANGMSDLFRHYIAGQLQLLPEFVALLAPTVNSFKRLVEGMWAPTRVTWGIENRTVALRVIPGSAKSTRAELRVGGADINPYLALAAALASGLHGIVNKTPLTLPPIEGNGYEADAVHLPRDLDGAADNLASSKAARNAFGDTFVDHFVQTRRWESRQFRAAVTDWELKRYFELI